MNAVGLRSGITSKKKKGVNECVDCGQALSSVVIQYEYRVHMGVVLQYSITYCDVIGQAVSEDTEQFQ